MGVGVCICMCVCARALVQMLRPTLAGAAGGFSSVENGRTIQSDYDANTLLTKEKTRWGGVDLSLSRWMSVDRRRMGAWAL